MTTILCFGNSNTWGMEPGTGARYPRDVRWPGAMRATLGSGFEIIEEGLPGRTTAFDAPDDPGRNGLPYLLPCLESHRPLDLTIMMLGTNDVQPRFHASAEEIGRGMESLVTIARPYAPVLVVAPAMVIPLPVNQQDIDETAVEKCAALPALYAAIAKRHGCAFLDASQVIVSSPRDGVHLDPEQQRILGAAIAATVREML